MKVAFLLHGRMKGKAAFIKKLYASAADFPSLSIQHFETTHHNHAITLAQEIVSAQFNYLIAVGGDGTLNQVINGVSKNESEPKIILGILPRGSGNDFARNFHGEHQLKNILQSISNATCKTVDVGKITYANAAGNEEIRYFINVADAGMGADVVLRFNKSNRKWGAQFNFMKAIVQTFLSFKRKQLHVVTPHWQWEGEAMAIIVANSRFFAGGLGIAPDAKIDDGVLNVTILGKISVLDYLKNISGLKKLKYIKHREVHYKSATQIELHAREGYCGLEADGEFFGFLPAKIELLPLHIRFLDLV
ncbi:MAG TPA: YegS/Rv2252/BmrU family lipid kinase [Cyclobacteriaceae bacterium]|nr:YegS/Rv2252/BmrU family lipid kinase [Cyclobacteriaceae bacterium]